MISMDYYRSSSSATPPESTFNDSHRAHNQARPTHDARSSPTYTSSDLTVPRSASSQYALHLNTHPHPNAPQVVYNHPRNPHYNQDISHSVTTSHPVDYRNLPLGGLHPPSLHPNYHHPGPPMNLVSGMTIYYPSNRPHHSLNKPKRKQVKNACINCQKACKKCDDGRPCARCIRYDLKASCQNSQRKERIKGIKRGPYKKREGKGNVNNPVQVPPPNSISGDGAVATPYIQSYSIPPGTVPVIPYPNAIPYANGQPAVKAEGGGYIYPPSFYIPSPALHGPSAAQSTADVVGVNTPQFTHTGVYITPYPHSYAPPYTAVQANYDQSHQRMPYVGGVQTATYVTSYSSYTGQTTPVSDGQATRQTSNGYYNHRDHIVDPDTNGGDVQHCNNRSSTYELSPDHRVEDGQGTSISPVSSHSSSSSGRRAGHEYH